MYQPKMQAIPRYVIGTVGMLMPVTVLLVIWKEADAILLIWCCAAASGLAVMGARSFGRKLTKLHDDQDKLRRLEAMLDAKATEED